MLVTMKEMLADAQMRHYAIPAFDVSNYEMMKAVLDICEEERSPALLMGLGVDLQGKGMDLIPAMIAEASRFYTIPVCLHLDHATDLELIKQAAAAGFSSVMYDGSTLPFEENARKTAEVVRYAHANGLTVEAELGHVYLSGAFAAHSDLESAITIGMFPDLPRERYTAIANTSLDGARILLLDRDRLQDVRHLIDTIYCVQFASVPDFLIRMQAAKFIPHTDLDRYPIIQKKLQERGL